MTTIAGKIRHNTYQKIPKLLYSKRAMGIEPTSTAWKAVVIAIIRRSRLLSLV